MKNVVCLYIPGLFWDVYINLFLTACVRTYVDRQTDTYKHTHTHTYIYIYIKKVYLINKLNFAEGIGYM